MTLPTAQQRKAQRLDFVAKALFVGNSMSTSAAADWDYFIAEPVRYAATLAWYRKQAGFAITAMDLYTAGKET